MCNSQSPASLFGPEKGKGGGEGALLVNTRLKERQKERLPDKREFHPLFSLSLSLKLA